MKHRNVVPVSMLIGLVIGAAWILAGVGVFGPTAVRAASGPLVHRLAHRHRVAAISSGTVARRGDLLTAPPRVHRDSLANRFAQLEDRLPALEALLGQCRKRGISTAYEMVDYTTIRLFIPWGRNDQSAAVATTLERLYGEATTNLQAYLQGTKQALAVPEYVSRRPTIDGYSFLGDMRWPDGHIEHHRPIFYVGYGFDYNVVRSIPDFTGLNMNIVQIDQIGPGNVVHPAGVLDWTTCSDTAKTQFSVDAAVAHSGTQSIRISNQAGAAGEAVLPLFTERNSTYRITAWVKGENVHQASLRTGYYSGDGGCNGFGRGEVVQSIPEGTYGWQKVEFSLTTGGGDNFLWGLRLQAAGPTDKLWIDDLSVSKVGSTENLIPDPSFETIPLHTATGLYASQTDLKAELLPLLRLAAEHNVAVNLLVNGSPRPNAAMVNVKDEAYKLSFELYLRTLIPLIKDHPALHSLCLTNEPSYWSDGDTTDRPAWQAYLQHVYGDVAHLNTVYGAHYATFADVPVGADKHHRPARGTGESAHLYDWIAFNDVQFAAYHHWLANLIHQMAPNLPIHSKIQVLNPGDGIDPARFAEFSQISGSDANSGWWYDLQGSLRVAPIFNSEDHLLQGVNDPRQTRMMLWQGAIHGRNASTIWVWERHAEDDLLQQPEFVVTIGKTAADLNRLAKEVTALHTAPTSTAMFHPYTALASGGNQTAEEWAATGVWMHGQRPALLTDKQMAAGQLRQYKLLLIPAGAPVARTTLTPSWRTLSTLEDASSRSAMNRGIRF